MNEILYGELLIEVMMEKIPVNSQNTAEKNLKILTQKAFAGYKNTKSISLQTFVTPNRLIVVVYNVPLFLEQHDEEIRGPKTSCDDQTIEKFLEKYSYNKDNAYIKTINHQDFWHINIQYEKIDSKEIIANAIVPFILNNLTWDEYMSWNVDLKWIRPARRLMCIFNKSPIIFHWDAAKLTSSPYSLYYFNSQEEFVCDGFISYNKLLREKNIFVSYYDRYNYIESQIRNLVKNLPTAWNLSRESYDIIGYVARSTESPVIYSVDQISRCNIPDDIVKLVLIHHEKFIPSFENNNLSNIFFTYANRQMQDLGLRFKSDITKCAEARLKDAELCWQRDLKITKDEYIDKLKHYSIYKNLGSVYQQTERLQNIILAVDNNAILLKAIEYLNLDLAMETVYEIPELRGIAAGLYSELVYNEDKLVKQIIKEVVSDNESIQISSNSLYLSILYHLDRLVGFFGIGVIPKSSSDPLALRRTAFIIIKLCNILQPDLDELIQLIREQYEAQGIILNDSFDNIIEFLQDRLKSLLESISPEFGKKFITNKITWKEINNLNSFLKYPQYYSELCVFYNRLIGLCGSKYLDGESKSEVFHTKLTDIINKKSSHDNYMNYLYSIYKECSVLFDDIKIINLDQSSFDKTIKILHKIKFEFDSYCDFRK